MRSMTAIMIMIAITASAPFLAGCQHLRPATRAAAAYETLPKDPHRDTEAARQHQARGVQLLKDGQIDQASQAFQAALSADLLFGPAHNNLGTIYLRQQKYYLAAWEFQYAEKLMPHQAEPRNNLGLVYEAVGKLDDAAKSYERALDLEPENPRVTGNLARVYVRGNRTDDRTRKLLEAVVVRDNRPEWIAWARERLALMGKPRSTTTAPATPDPSEPPAAKPHGLQDESKAGRS